jgi:hypothetical protein
MAKRGRKTKVEKLAMLERRRIVAQRYLSGEPTWMIALALEVTPQTVNGDLRAIRKAWWESAVADLGEHQAEELAKVNEVERCAWLSFERSQANDKPGDPRRLVTVLDCVKRRCQMLGVDLPRRELIMQRLAKEIRSMTDEELMHALGYDESGPEGAHAGAGGPPAIPRTG